MMPRMNGAELAERVREISPNMPVLVVTGYAGGDLEMAQPQLAKPFRQADLVAAIERLVGPQDNVVSLPVSRR
jgi:CheY-like chemotaxis protein